VITVPPNTNKGNHPAAALNPSSPSTPPAYPHMLILSAVEHATLGIKLVHSRPGQPEGRGKIERWFRTVRDQFLVEITDEVAAPD
jgi:transposase InsO family protein